MAVVAFCPKPDRFLVGACRKWWYGGRTARTGGIHTYIHNRVQNSHCCCNGDLISQQESLGQLELVWDMLLELLSVSYDATSVRRSHQTGFIVATEIHGFHTRLVKMSLSSLLHRTFPKTMGRNCHRESEKSALWGTEAVYILHLPFLSSFGPSGLIYLCLSGYCVWWVFLNFQI